MSKLYVLFFLVVVTSANADQSDKKLNHLFNEIKKVNNEVEAINFINEIWKIWSQTRNFDAQFMFDRGVNLMNIGQYEKSITAFSNVISMEPNFAEAWNKRATVYYLNGNFEKSLKDIDKTLSLEPRHFGALDGLAQIYFEKEDFIASAKIYSKILKIIPYSLAAKKRLKIINEKYI
jgi:tetratricopeptide (TPR) repeat protein